MLSCIPKMIQRAAFERVQSPGVETTDKGGSINSIQPPLSVAQPRELSIPLKGRPLNHFGYYLPNADWRQVTVEKLNRRGETELTAAGMPKPFRYDLESSTGDLYGFKGDPDAPETVAAKSLLIFCITPLYFVGMICAHLLKTAADVLSLFWKVLPQLIKDLNSKGPGAAFGNSMMAAFIEIPLEIGADLWRLCRSPFYAVALEVACLYTMVSPYEGRKWIGKIESLWHEGLHYHLDVRDTDPARCFEEIIYDGKILFLGICMQKMGNIHDKIGNLDKYRIL